MDLNKEEQRDKTPEYEGDLSSPDSLGTSNNSNDSQSENNSNEGISPDAEAVGETIQKTGIFPSVESPMSPLSEEEDSKKQVSETDPALAPPILEPTPLVTTSKKQKSKALTEDEIDIKNANKTRRRVKKLRRTMLSMSNEKRAELKNDITRDFITILRLSNHPGTFKAHRNQLIRIRQTLNKGLDCIEDPVKCQHSREKKAVKKQKTEKKQDSKKPKASKMNESKNKKDKKGKK
jgi:hypothetical protein